MSDDKARKFDEIISDANAISEMWLRKHKAVCAEVIYENPTRDPKEIQVEFLEAKVCMLVSWFTLMMQGDYEDVRQIMDAMVTEIENENNQEDYG